MCVWVGVLCLVCVCFLNMHTVCVCTFVCKPGHTGIYLCRKVLIVLVYMCVVFMCLSIFPLSTLLAPHHPRATICCRGYRAALASAHQAQPLPQTLSVLESTPQVRGMHTIIRYEPRNPH